MISQLQRVYEATKYAVAGIKHAIRWERAIRQEIYVMTVLCLLSFFIAQDPLDYILLITPLIMTVIVELINTAMEKTLDIISDHYHPLIQKAKDMCSAAVFLSLLCVIFIWSMIVWKNWQHVSLKI